MTGWPRAASCRRRRCLVCTQDKKGMTALHLAAANNTNEKVAELLLQHNADVHAKARGRHHLGLRGACMHCAMRGRPRNGVFVDFAVDN